MTTTPIRIPIEHDALEHTTGLLHEPAPGAPERGSGILLAHGAGADIESEFMVAMAAGLAARGFGVLRFRYPYMERRVLEGRRLPPDRAPRLEDAHQAALDALAAHWPRKRHLLAGKSLGGRMGSRIAAKGARAAGLILFGYPLHPPRRPEKQRSEHFPALVQPALFLQGTRDDLCDLELLRAALETYGGTATLKVIEGGDHGFDVLKRSGRTREEVHGQLLDSIDEWEARTWPD